MNIDPKIRKNAHKGWQAITDITDVNGFDWRITTELFSRGLIVSRIQKGHKKSKYFKKIGDYKILNKKESVKATEKAIKQEAGYALILFLLSINE